MPTARRRKILECGVFVSGEVLASEGGVTRLAGGALLCLRCESGDGSPQSKMRAVRFELRC